MVAFGFLGLGRAPPAMDDLHVSNDDDANHTVRIEITPAIGSATTFERTVRLRPDEHRSSDGTTEHGRAYRLVVTVDDGERQSFEIRGPDVLYTIEVTVGANASASVGGGCA